jgi:two-component system, chemotaxis family, protein-glutamate methylesterase/glutaminase
VCHPADLDTIERGTVYIAPPGFHMIVEGGVVRVVRGPRENLNRPAIDLLVGGSSGSEAAPQHSFRTL